MFFPPYGFLCLAMSHSFGFLMAFLNRYVTRTAKYLKPRDAFGGVCQALNVQMTLCILCESSSFHISPLSGYCFWEVHRFSCLSNRYLNMYTQWAREIPIAVNTHTSAALDSGAICQAQEIVWKFLSKGNWISSLFGGSICHFPSQPPHTSCQ